VNARNREILRVGEAEFKLGFDGGLAKLMCLRNDLDPLPFDDLTYHPV